MEWSKVAVEVLIEAYSKEVCLYNNKSPLYHNKHARQRALQNVCDALQEVRPTTSAELSNKMKSLRTTFVTEFNKTNRSKKSGSGLEDVYKPTVWYFEKLLFLKDHIQPRKGTSTADISTVDGASEETSMYSICEDTLYEVPIVEDWALLSPVPSTSCSSAEMPPQSGHSPTPQTSPMLSEGNINSRGQKRKRLMQEEDRLIKEASEVLSNVTKKQNCELDAFGAFVTSSLKGLKNKSLAIKGKRLIFDIVLSLQEEDLLHV